MYVLATTYWIYLTLSQTTLPTAVSPTRRTWPAWARQAYLQVTNGMSQYQALKQALNSSQINLAAVTHGFEAGSRINTDVLDAQQKVTDTQQRLAQQRYAILMAQLHLLASTGNLSDARLRDISHTLN